MREEKLKIVAVGGPGDGRRYEMTNKMTTLRVFNSGPMRGNPVPASIHVMRGTYTDYELAEFGVEGDSSVFLLKPAGTTLVGVMTLLTMGYDGTKFGVDLEKIAVAHVATMLREAHEWVVHDGDTFGCGDTERRADLLSRLETFFAAYDAETSEAISAPRALQ